MKRYATAIAAIAICGAIAGTAAAQTVPYNNDITRTELRRFDRYLDAHPETAQKLEANPGLINDPRFVADHPELHEFLRNHPGVREEIHETPGQFMYREGHYEWRENGAHPLATTDRYMDSHPEVAQQLSAHPGLIDDPKYIASHPGLHDYLRDHPLARADWKSHPYRYMAAERRYDQKH